MIPDSIAKHILTMGVDYHAPKGGIAQVLNSYSQIFETFRFIPTTNTNKGFLYRQLTGLSAALKLIKLIRQKEIKIVHLHSASGKSFYRKSLYINICRLFHVTVLCHMHSGHFVHFIHKCPHFIKRTLHKCDSIIVLSPSWETFYRNLGCSHIDIVDNIILPPQKTEEKKNDNLLHLVFLGNLTPKKGFYDLLQALGRHKELFAGKVKLHIGGLGDMQAFAQETERWGIADMLEYHGFVSGTEKCRLFTLGDIYVLPSYFEGMPISILEAMSYGMPTLATRVGSIPEIIADGETGKLINVGDIDGIASAIQWFLDNPEARATMSRKAEENSKKYFPQHIEQELMEVYNRYL